MNKQSAQDFEILLKNFDKTIQSAQNKGYSLSYITPYRAEKWLESSIAHSFSIANISVGDDFFVEQKVYGQSRYTLYFTKNNSDLQKNLPYINPIINYFLVYGTKPGNSSPSQLRLLNAIKTGFFPTPKLITSLDEVVIKTLPNITPENLSNIEQYINSTGNKNICCQAFPLNTPTNVALLYKLDLQSLTPIISDISSFSKNYKNKLNDIKREVSPIINSIPLPQNKTEKKV